MGNQILNPDQTNTKAGGIIVIAAEALTGFRSRLGVLVNDTGVLEVKMPDSLSELALVVIDEEGAAGEAVGVSPITPGENFRCVLNGTCDPAAVLVLCDPAASSGANMGKVEALPTTEGIYFSPGIAEEAGVDEQHIRVRPFPRLVYVGTAFTSATPAATGAATSSYGFTEAQANAILTNVREIRAFMVAQGWKATS